MDDTEFAALLDQLGLPAVGDVMDVSRQEVTFAAGALHNMDPDQVQELLDASARCAALALAWNERVRRTLLPVAGA